MLHVLISAATSFTVGVLSIQGGISQITASLLRQGVNVEQVITASALHRVDALVIPGGESTTLHETLEPDLRVAVTQFSQEKPVWGICAGLIALADDLDGSPIFGGIDVTVKRNGYGRQSSTAFRMLSTGRGAYFVRAPKIVRVGDSVEVLARLVETEVLVAYERHETCDHASRQDDVVAVRSGHLMATAFHPEISGDDTWTAYFLSDVCGHSVTAMHSPPDASTQAPWYSPEWNVPGSTGAKRAFAVYQQGGVIMDVTNPEQARLAERAGAVAVMALERIPADIRADGGVARSSDPGMIQEILDAVTIPVMAKARIGHFYEAKLLEALDVDCIDESEVLTAADEAHHIDKNAISVPFVCGAQDLGDALRRISEGAAMIRLKGDAGTGNVLHAVRHARAVFSEIRRLTTMRDDELYTYAKNNRVSVDLVRQTRDAGRLPVVTFAAGGIATPADVGLLMELGVDGVFVGSGIFKGENPERRARAMVLACTHFRNATAVVQLSAGLGRGMPGLLEHTTLTGPGVDVAVRA